MFFAINLKFFHVAKFLLHRNMSLASATNMACSVVHMFAHMDKKHQLFTSHLATNVMYVTTLPPPRDTADLHFVKETLVLGTWEHVSCLL